MVTLLALYMAIITFRQDVPLQGFFGYLQQRAVQDLCLERRIIGQDPPACNRGAPNYISQSDRLKLSAWTYVANNDMRVRGRLLRPDGTHSDFERTLRPNTNLTESSVLFQVGEGCITQLSVSNSRSDVCRGQAYASVGIVPGLASGAAPIANLASGYVSSLQPLTYPGSKQEAPDEGNGLVWEYTGANPAPGAEPDIFGFSTVSWRLLQFQVQLATDATAGNRQLIFHVYGRAGASVQEVVSPYLQPPSTTRNYIFQSGGQEGVQGVDTILVPFTCCGPPLCNVHYNVCVHGTWGAGDNFGTPSASVEEYLCLCA